MEHDLTAPYEWAGTFRLERLLGDLLARTGPAMKIISKHESMQILRNDLRKAVLEKWATELREAGAEKRESILSEIEREIEKEVQRCAMNGGLSHVIY